MKRQRSRSPTRHPYQRPFIQSASQGNGNTGKPAEEFSQDAFDSLIKDLQATAGKASNTEQRDDDKRLSLSERSNHSHRQAYDDRRQSYDHIRPNYMDTLPDYNDKRQSYDDRRLDINDKRQNYDDKGSEYTGQNLYGRSANTQSPPVQTQSQHPRTRSPPQTQSPHHRTHFPHFQSPHPRSRPPPQSQSRHPQNRSPAQIQSLDSQNPSQSAVIATRSPSKQPSPASRPVPSPAPIKNGADAPRDYEAHSSRFEISFKTQLQVVKTAITALQQNLSHWEEKGPPKVMGRMGTLESDIRSVKQETSEAGKRMDSLSSETKEITSVQDDLLAKVAQLTARLGVQESQLEKAIIRIKELENELESLREETRTGNDHLSKETIFQYVSEGLRDDPDINAAFQQGLSGRDEAITKATRSIHHLLKIVGDAETEFQVLKKRLEDRDPTNNAAEISNIKDNLNAHTLLLNQLKPLLSPQSVHNMIVSPLQKLFMDYSQALEPVIEKNMREIDLSIRQEVNQQVVAWGRMVQQQQSMTSLEKQTPQPTSPQHWLQQQQLKQQSQQIQLQQQQQKQQQQQQAHSQRTQPIYLQPSSSQPQTIQPSSLSLPSTQTIMQRSTTQSPGSESGSGSGPGIISSHPHENGSTVPFSSRTNFVFNGTSAQLIQRKKPKSTRS